MEWWHAVTGLRNRSWGRSHAPFQQTRHRERKTVLRWHIPHGLDLISLLLHDYFQCRYINEAPARPCFVVFVGRCNEYIDGSRPTSTLEPFECRNLPVSELPPWHFFILQIQRSSTARKILPMEAGVQWAWTESTWAAFWRLDCCCDEPVFLHHRHPRASH